MTETATKLCEYVEKVSGLWVCPVCKNEAKTSHRPVRECGPPKPRPEPTPPAQNVGKCIHRGDKVADRECKPCQTSTGQKSIPVFTCAKYGECTLNATSIRPRIQACATCLDYESVGGVSTTPIQTNHIPKRLRVLLIAPCLHNPGGIERWLIGMARFLPEISNGMVTVAGAVIRHSRDADRAMYAELSKYTKTILYQDNTLSKTTISQLAQSADVIVASGVSQIDELIIGSTCPVAFLSHSCCDYSRKLSREAMERGRVTHWASVGHLAKGVFPDEIVDRVTIVENGAEVERCVPVRGRAWQRKQWGVRDDQLAVGFIGRLSDEKRPLALAEAIAHLPQNYIGIVHGRGIHEKETMAKSIRLVGNRVRFMGNSLHIGDILAGLDVWLLASPAEGFCLARTEAHLAGVPVVSTPTGEIPRLEAEYGKLTHQIPIGADGKTIAEVVRQAIENREESILISNRAKELAWNRYTSAAMAGRWIDYLTEICGVG